MSYYNVFRLSCPLAQTTGTWGFDLTVMPNLLVPLYYVKVDSVGAATETGNYMNLSFTPPGVPAPTYPELFNQWSALGVEAHRLIAMSVTAYQDGPALANQGTVTAAQWPVARSKWYHNSANIYENTPYQHHISSSRIASYTDNDFARYERSQHLPNAYFSESKEGCYLPLRLTRTCQHWTTEADLEFIGDPIVGGTNGNMRLGTVNGQPDRHAAPFPALSAARSNDVILDTNFGGLWGDRVFAPLNDTWGGISCRNLSYQTSYAFYIRQVVECRVTPTSLLAPQVQMSPPYDPTAIAAYFRINRELKDAYPADFNDLGKIWDVIKGAAKVALPALGMMPGPLGLIGKAGSAILGGIEGISSAANAGRRGNGRSSSSRGASDQPPKAALERAQQKLQRKDDDLIAQAASNMRKVIARKGVGGSSRRKKGKGGRNPPKQGRGSGKPK